MKNGTGEDSAPRSQLPAPPWHIAGLVPRPPVCCVRQRFFHRALSPKASLVLGLSSEVQRSENRALENALCVDDRIRSQATVRPLEGSETVFSN
ncbi:hypothetical protein SKAU_G00346210 [Synaphobranchus kaupii]|uniref:Uncharacterized protein n=1 Tax=Synaphobranchus kaupii TaxID=118154 RepID=A0A9Q1IFK4_SYNKA|nr:hypothetical protein SKAU_G00346210 [Synaphobranchus kaupii]